MTLYIVFNWGCVEPSIEGPYSSDEERVIAAREMAGEEHCLCRLDIDNFGIPTVESFGSTEINPEEDGEESEDETEPDDD